MLDLPTRAQRTKTFDRRPLSPSQSKLFSRSNVDGVCRVRGKGDLFFGFWLVSANAAICLENSWNFMSHKSKTIRSENNMERRGRKSKSCDVAFLSSCKPKEESIRITVLRSRWSQWSERWWIIGLCLVVSPFYCKWECYRHIIQPTTEHRNDWTQ